eukprot:g1756.t1
MEAKPSPVLARSVAAENSAWDSARRQDCYCTRIGVEDDRPSGSACSNCDYALLVLSETLNLVPQIMMV